MFQKIKYTALLLLGIFVFKLFSLNVLLVPPLNTPPTKALVAKSLKRVAKRRKVDPAQYSAQAVLAPAEVSEESTESDTSENLIKGAKYPAQLAFLHCFRGFPGNISLRTLAEILHTKTSLRTYLSISVLRI